MRNVIVTECLKTRILNETWQCLGLVLCDSTNASMQHRTQEEKIVSGNRYRLDVTKSSYVNGANFVIDGGFTSWR